MLRRVLLITTLTLLAHPLAGQTPMRDTLHVVTIPGEVPRKPTTVDSVYLEVPQKGDGVWFAGQYAEYARTVRLAGIASPTDCERREVEFTYLSNASVNGAPPSVKVRGEWVPEDRSNLERFEVLLDEKRLGRLATSNGGACVSVAHWRLGDNPGRHYLRARLIRKDDSEVPARSAANTAQLFTAIAHAPPAIIAGLVYPIGGDDEDENDVEDDEENDRTLGTVVGFDFPIVLGLFSEDTQEFLAHFRPMIATNFSNPGEDLFIGLELLPLLPHGGARSAANPLQLTFGYKFDNDGNDTPFLGVHYSTTGLLGDFLKAVGVGR